jgi:hypothetical protein
LREAAAEETTTRGNDTASGTGANAPIFPASVLGYAYGAGICPSVHNFGRRKSKSKGYVKVVRRFGPGTDGSSGLDLDQVFAGFGRRGVPIPA